MIRLAADEDLDHHIVRALRHRMTNVDIVRVQEAELAGAADQQVLAWVAETGRVLVSHDASTMTAAAYARIEGGAPTLGVIIVPQWLSIGEALDDLVLIFFRSSAQSMCDDGARRAHGATRAGPTGAAHAGAAAYSGRTWAVIPAEPGVRLFHGVLS